MEFSILGPLELRDGEQDVPLRGPKQRALLAVLLLNANRVVALERLVEELWEDPPPTAVQAVHVYLSKLRKVFAAAGAGAPEVLTKPPGYVLRIDAGTVDLHRFEALVETARRALEGGDARTASSHLAEALALWRGPALDGFVEEPFAQPARARLDELRLSAREWKGEADLALGRHEELIGELRELAAANPLQERVRGLLMLALYRSGRQAEALQVYQDTRGLLVEELGLEPSQSLQQLERAILQQDPSLDLARAGTPAPAEAPATDDGARAVLVGAIGDGPLGGVVSLAAMLAAAEPTHEVILVRLVESETPGGSLTGATAELESKRAELAELGLGARSAAFTSSDPSGDLLRLLTEQTVDLLLLDGATLEHESSFVTAVLEDSPCDVALLLQLAGQPLRLDGRPPLVVFGGADHDWAALELGVWLARGGGTPLRLAGTAADPARGRRDASRLLATASLVVQQFSGVSVEPVLATSGSDGVLESAGDAGVVVLGVHERSLQRLAGGYLRIAREAAAPTLLVSRGLRPGGLAPDGLTRYTWSLAAEGSGTGAARENSFQQDASSPGT